MKKQKVLKPIGGLIPSGVAISRRVCVSIPMTGLLRAEWVHARYGQIMPVNWSNAELIQQFSTLSPFSFPVDDARNVSVEFVVKEKFEWLIFIDHDVVLPPDTFLRFNEYINKGDIPVVSGWYNAKGNPPEPLVFRGQGNSWYQKWKAGQTVWCDGIPMGCALINVKLLKMMYEASPEYTTQGGTKLRRVFFTPRQAIFNKETGGVTVSGGTEDLWWCERVIKEGWLKKAGFTAVANKKYPFLFDSRIRCGHIDLDGRIF